MSLRGRFNKEKGKMEWWDTKKGGPISTARKGIPYAQPLVSMAAGVHPDQVAEANAHLQKHGVKGARYRPDGQAEFDSRQGRREFGRATGYYDADAGYGDWAGK